LKRILDFISLISDSYLKIVHPVCEKYGLTATEFDILLFLANNPEYDTATEIVEKRHIVKSHVSISVKSLEQRGYIERTYKDNNRRTIHLKICASAEEAIKAGQKAQFLFYKILTRDIPKEQLENLQNCFELMQENLKKF